MRNLSVSRITRRQCESLPWDNVLVTFSLPDDEETSCFVLSSGEVYSGDEVVGSVSNGILSAAVSPDGEIVAICSNAGTMLLMTTTEWDLVAEVQLDYPAQSCSWRLDGEFIATFQGDSVLKVYGRDGSLTATSEADFRNIGHVTCSSFGRQGGFIAAGVPLKRTIYFFERNALRHHRSDLQLESENLNDIRWNTSGEILAVFHDRRCLSIYSRSNFKWYKKRELRFETDVARIKWDELEDMRISIYFTDDTCECVDFYWSVCTSTDGNDTVAVIDGRKLLLTPLSTAIVPPPMSLTEAEFELPVNEVVFAQNCTDPTVVLADGTATATGKDRTSQLKSMHVRAAAMCGPDVLTYVHMEEKDGEVLAWTNLETRESSAVEISKGQSITCSAPSATMNHIWIATSDKRAQKLSLAGEVTSQIDIAIIALSLRSIVISGNSEPTECLLCLSRRGALQLIRVDTGRIFSLSLECTSFDVTDNFLAFTARSNAIHILPLTGDEGTTLETILSSQEAFRASEGRPIDRASRIVKILHDGLRIVLQAPRGNLETIVPRQMALFALRRNLSDGKYSEAFRLVREQRLDGNLLITDEFDARKFVAEISSAQKLSVFVTSLSEEALAKVQSDFVEALLLDRAKYLHTIVTVFMSRQPPQIGAAIREISMTNAGVQEGAMDYMLVLAKSHEEVYQEALATYDLKIASLVAAHSQLDPKEYRDDLTELSSMSASERNFTIAKRIGRYEDAFKFCTEFQTKEQTLEFAIEHELFLPAVNHFKKEDSLLKRVLEAFADSKIKNGKYSEAACLFIEAGSMQKAAEAYRDAGNYLSAIACSRNVQGPEENKPFLESVADRLEDLGRSKERAFVLAECLGELQSAVECLCSAGEWINALETASRTTGAWNYVSDQMLDSSRSQVNEMNESSTKIEEKGNRLAFVREVKAKKLHREEEEGSDMYPESEISSLASDFTFGTDATSTSELSTAASLTIASTSKKKDRYAARRKAKAEKRKKRVPEGHPQEEEYLVEYTRKLIPRQQYLADVRTLIDGLILISKSHEAAALQSACQELVNKSISLPEDVTQGFSYIHDKSWMLDVLSSVIDKTDTNWR
mmetsp:Transcript_8146/g.24527  ORF Transcript_8146/g.24527 Transcript_8146/m.24527 type:complete len:1098 (+) Transcript_8146:220-3513(+)